MNIPIQKVYAEVYDTPLQIFVCNFDRETGSRSVYDETGQSEQYSYACVANGITQTWSKFGKGSFLDVTQCWHLLPRIINNFTLHFFFRAPSVVNWGSVIRVGEFDTLTGSAKSRIDMGCFSYQWFLQGYDKTGTYYQYGLWGVPLPNTTYHIAIVVEDSCLKLYIDGTLRITKTYNVNDFWGRDNLPILCIGNWWDGCPYGLLFDAMELTREVKWRENFTPPTVPPRFESGGARTFVPMLSSTYTEPVSGDRYFEGNIVVPVLGVDGSIEADSYVGSLSAELKAITVAAYSGAFADISIPVITGSGTASYDTIAFGYAELQRITLSASGYQQPSGSLNVDIPAIRLSASGQCHPLASLSKSLQLITLTASGLAGESISLSRSIGAVKLRSEAYWTGVNSLAASIPALLLRGHITGEMIALSMNMRNNSLARYDNFEFNSICKFKDVYLGCKTDGIRVLDGTVDETAEIEWSVDLGDLDLAGAKLRYLWLTGAIQNTVALTMSETAGEQNSYEYIQEPLTDDNTEMRIKVGKNIRSKQSRYINPVISGYGAAKIDRIHLFGETGKQR